jgi:Ca2+-binding RTX toxin-like protein
MATVVGHDYSETLNAFDGVTNSADWIFGLGGVDTIFGLGGADDIKGGGGADIIDGGSGSDTALYLDSSEGVIVNLTTGTKGVGGTAEGDTLTSIENLTGSSYDDALTGDTGANKLSGDKGDDILKGGGGADELYGGANADMLMGGAGGDVLDGGTGVDTASYGGSSAGVVVSLLSDTAYGGDADGDELNSIENLTGSAYGDNLYGNDSANVLNGMGGADALKGFGGADKLNGGENADYLDGGAGFDVLNGGGGSDTLIGGADKDTMFGGTGADVFKIEALTDAPAAGYGNTDYIPDFSEADGDIINLSLIDANTLVGGNQAFTFIGNENAFTGAAGDLRFAAGFVEGDVNGDAIADFQIELDVAVVHNFDFIL